MLRIFLAALSLGIAPAAAIAQSAPKPFDISAYDRHLAVEPTQMLVLGTAHLSGWKEFVDRPQLDIALTPLLARLEAFAPDTIAVEDVSGPNCAHLKRYGMVYAAGEDYCRNLDFANEFTGLSPEDAENKILETLLSGGPGDEPAARRTMAATYLAAGDRASALLQWLRLSPEDRVAGKEINQEMVDWLAKYGAGLNESVSIGVALGVRLGHERIWAVDDHSADQLYLRQPDDFGNRMREIWRGSDPALRADREAAEEKLKADGDVMAYYRFLNSDKAADLTIRGDFALGLADTDPRGIGQDYANWWQVRNLRMVANIVAAASLNRSERTLAIVGASHKAYYEAYLDMMHHVAIVDTSTLLAE